VVGVRANTPDGPREIHAPLTVIATGASTGLLTRAGLLSAPPAYGRAARAYFTEVRGLSDAVEFHFDAVPLPGYGWVFPTGPTSANVGAGYFSRRGAGRSPAQVYEAFIANPRTARLLNGARAASPVKGYPLRFDFPTARLAAPGVLMIGEACGLVNPLTGEGIDYALESAEVAAEALGEAVAMAALPPAYTRAMHARFLRTFVNIARVRDLYLRPFLLNRFVSAANRHADLARLLLDVALGHLDPLAALSLKTLGRILAG
jgi:flavin-dependent dehydrogenase